MKIVDVMEYLSYVIGSDKGKDRLNTLEGMNIGRDKWWTPSSSNRRVSIFPPVVASFVIIACTDIHNTASGPQYLGPKTCEDALIVSHLYASIRIFKTDLAHTSQAVRAGRTDNGPSQLAFFPIVEKRLIPGRVESTVRTTFGPQFPFPRTGGDSLFIFQCRRTRNDFI
jgi:hypothetical protein